MLVAILGILGNTWKENNGRDTWYLMYPSRDDEPGYQPLIIPARFLLLNSTMIPISLKVTLDLAKLVYSNMIAGDQQLYDPVTDTAAIPNSTALSEDLGQIEYVLTDKTGTLTQNIMVLKMVTVLGRAQDTYGEDDSVMPSSEEALAEAGEEGESEGGSGGGAAGHSESKRMGGDSGSVSPTPSTVGMGRTSLLSNHVAARTRREAQDGATASSVLEMLRNMSLNNDVRPEPKENQPASGSGGDGGGGAAAALSMPAATGKLAGLDEIPVKYKASSPDEEAFLKGSAQLGVALLARDGGTDEQTVTVNEPGGRIEYKQVAVFPFDSDRKRMSVLVRLPAGTPGGRGQSRLYVKGADDMLLNTKPGEIMTAQGQEPHRDRIQSRVNRWAKAGYRTLVFGYRDLSEDEHAEFVKEFQAANTALEGRKDKRNELFARMERDLVLVGATAVEDKLQDQVPETIAKLRQGNVRFWMCTGDKQSTAGTIAKTCRLLPVRAGAQNQSDTIPPLVLSGKDQTEVGARLRELKQQLQRQGYQFGKELPGERTGLLRIFGAAWCGTRGVGAPDSSVSAGPSAAGSGAGSSSSNPLAGASGGPAKEPYTIIVKGDTVRIALEFHRDEFAALCLQAKSVICCRVTPAQKAQLVRLVRDAGHVALAIGDGGNDVSMIQEAQVGVGIRGKEGLQASRAADYQVAFFRALERLLLVHGHYSYYRTAVIAQYSFYKSFVFCFIQIGFQWLAGFSGVSLFNSLCVAAYNAALFVPIVFFCVDKDINQVHAVNFPTVYRRCNENTFLNYREFGLWLLRAAYHAIVMMLILFLSARRWEEGSVYESLGLVMFNGYVLVQDFVMLYELSIWTWYNIIAIFGMHILSLVVGVMANNTSSLSNFIDLGSFNVVVWSPELWLTNLLMVVVAIGPIEFYRAWMVRSGTEESGPGAEDPYVTLKFLSAQEPFDPPLCGCLGAYFRCGLCHTAEDERRLESRLSPSHSAARTQQLNQSYRQMEQARRRSSCPQVAAQPTDWKSRPSSGTCSAGGGTPGPDGPGCAAGCCPTRGDRVKQIQRAGNGQAARDSRL